MHRILNPRILTLVTYYLTYSVTNSCLVDLIDVNLECEDANSKLVDVVTVVDVDDEDHVSNSFFFADLGAEVWS